MLEFPTFKFQVASETLVHVRCLVRACLDLQFKPRFILTSVSKKHPYYSFYKKEFMDH